MHSSPIKSRIELQAARKIVPCDRPLRASPDEIEMTSAPSALAMKMLKILDIMFQFVENLLKNTFYIFC